jgi:hypothetical protein
MHRQLNLDLRRSHDPQPMALLQIPQMGEVRGVAYDHNPVPSCPRVQGRRFFVIVVNALLKIGGTFLVS